MDQYVTLGTGSLIEGGSMCFPEGFGTLQMVLGYCSERVGEEGWDEDGISLAMFLGDEIVFLL